MKKKSVLSTLIGLLFMVGMGLFFIYIFAFSIKGTEEYACALEQARSSRVVGQALGEPIEPGLIAFLSLRESQGSRVQSTFSTSLAGPRGDGRIRVDAYRAPTGSYLNMQFKSEGDWVSVYSGDYPCR